jgi:phenylacetate-CoA ligase
MLIIRGVNLFPTQVEELILKERALSGHYVLEVSRPRQLDELKIIVELRPESEGSGDGGASAAQRLQHNVKSLIGVSVAVELVPTGRVERSIGKAKRVIDLRPKP